MALNTMRGGNDMKELNMKYLSLLTLILVTGCASPNWEEIARNMWAQRMSCNIENTRIEERVPDQSRFDSWYLAQCVGRDPEPLVCELRSGLTEYVRCETDEGIQRYLDITPL